MPENLVVGIVIVLLVLVLYYYRDSLKKCWQSYETTKSCSDCSVATASSPVVVPPVAVAADAVEGLSNDANYKYDASSVGGYDYSPEGNGEDSLDYDQYFKSLSLDDSVSKNHASFVYDLGRTSKGAANRSILEPVDVQNWMGLRRPNYLAVTENDDARQVSGFVDDNLPKKNTSFRI